MRPLKLAVISDLHLEMVDSRLPDRLGVDVPDDADALMLAGDVHLGEKGVEWAAARHPDIPVFYVAGNHEFYGCDRLSTIERLRAAAAATDNVLFMENEKSGIDVDGRRLTVLGCTLWTDFRLYGETHEPIAKANLAKGLNDFRLIREGARTFTPSDAAEAHRESRDWLGRQLSEPMAENETRVVMTHHGVSNWCQPEVYRQGALAPGFVSAMEDFVAGSGAPLWITGHTHYDHDFAIGDTRVCSRQEKYAHENEDWGRMRPLVVEV